MRTPVPDPQVNDPQYVLLSRITGALERMSPPPVPAPDFSVARLFHYDAASARFTPAPDYLLPLDLLMGVERQKLQFCEAVRRFAVGLPSNHALLWGVRGTGKSSMVKATAMAQATATAALKLVEVDRDHIAALPALFAGLRSYPERFIVMCDDLSFEEGADAAKSLKSALEGGVTGPPENVMFVATSNRRHLAPQSHDEGKGMLATAEQAEETVSVSDRFGLWIGFPPMDQPSYLDAVNAYADRFHLDAGTEFERRALQWAQRRGGRSGRTAWQFIRDVAGEAGVSLPL